MGVFTAVTDEEFLHWVQPSFGFSKVSALSPVEDGFQNTNYYFWGDHKKYVFTIFENTPEDYVDYYVDFVRLLATRNAPVPASLFPRISAGRWWHKKPCCISPFLPGSVLATPKETHCYKLGRMTAHLHINSETYPMKPVPYGAAWLATTRDKLLQQTTEPLPPAIRDFLPRAVHSALKFYTQPLPWRACHTDMHRSNVLWDQDKISGVIDFYSGGAAPLIFDLGILVCNWCLDPSAPGKTFSLPLVKSLLTGYQSLRALTPEEKEYLSGAVIAAAVKFWVWCLNERYFLREALMMTPKDPKEFHEISLKAFELGPGDWIKNCC